MPTCTISARSPRTNWLPIAPLSRHRHNKLESVELLLKQWGCLVLTADSGERALAISLEHDAPPDAILSDYRLRNGETGIEVIRNLEREWGATPAMLITGDTAPNRLKDAAASGYLLLHKPLDPIRLKQAICRMLGERSQTTM